MCACVYIYVNVCVLYYTVDSKCRHRHGDMQYVYTMFFSESWWNPSEPQGVLQHNAHIANLQQNKYD